MFETILYSIENDLASISLNRPEVSNGFNIPMCQEILAALEDSLFYQQKGKSFQLVEI